MNAVAQTVADRDVSPVTWLDANQHHLCAEFARIEALLRSRSGGSSTATVADAQAAVDQARAAMPADPAIDVLAAVFALTRFERDVLLLAAGVEMSSSLASACAVGPPGPSGVAATFSAALAALPDAHWSAIAPESPLRRWRLIELADGASLVASALRIDERILHYLAGLNELDARLQPLVRPVRPARLLADSHRRALVAVDDALRGHQGERPVVQLYGDDPDGQEDVAARAAAACGCVLYALDAEAVPAGRADRRALTTLWTREAILLDAALLVRSHDAPPERALCEFLDDAPGIVFLAGREPAACRRVSLDLIVDHPSVGERCRLWRLALGSPAGSSQPTAELMAGHYRMSARAIARAGDAAREELARGGEPRTLLRAASASRQRSTLGMLAQRIVPTSDMRALVLPDDVLETLHEIAAQVRHRATVHHAWGLGPDGSRGLGITALFTGEPGTGKTMAAEALAIELGLELHRIDLAGVVSKYIGETEKNLRRVFDAGEDSGAILLFDEADALFGKRSDVKDSRDRYANVEINYLLQRMESYSGLAVLTTNMKSALDRAFQRRIRFIVQFPFPDAGRRERIWRGAFPPTTPVGALDYARLARLNVSGGGIRNIALNAAFRAANDGEPVGMSHVLAAARGEFAKQDRTLTDAEMRGAT